MQRNKYLEDLGLKIEDYGSNYIYKEKEGTNRRKLFEQERKDYGFDERETWSLDYYFAEWLYSRLMMYKEVASNVVNLKYHKIEWKSKEITQLEAIDILINVSKDYILSENDYIKDTIPLEEVNKIYNTFYESMELWGKILRYMWW